MCFPRKQVQNVSGKECLAVSNTFERLSKMTTRFGKLERVGDIEEWFRWNCGDESIIRLG